MMDHQQDHDDPNENEEYYFDESAEFSDDYRPGRLHPIHFGDCFKGSRYKVLRKLGAGSFSTVWLARDRELSRYIGLKVATAKSSATENESKILGHLFRPGYQHPGQKCVTALLDIFQHQGPNGLHRCLVFDVMGPTSSTMFSKLPSDLRPPPGESREPSESERGRLPFWMAKSILKQTLLGIAFMHQNGIVHGDLQPGNILFPVKDLSTLPEYELVQADPQEDLFRKTVNSNGEVQFHEPEADSLELDMDYYHQRYIDGKPDPSSPRYIVTKKPMFKYIDLNPPLRVKISDLGGAFFATDPPTKPVTPLALRSPEIILGETVSEAQDIWSFGCLMFEYLTGKMLFSVMPPMPSDWGHDSIPSGDDEIQDVPSKTRESAETSDGKDHKPFEDVRKDGALQGDNIENNNSIQDEDDGLVSGTDDSTDDDHLLQMAAVLGPVPSSFLAKFPRSDIYFNTNGEITKHYVGELTNKDDFDPTFILPPIATYLEQEKGADLLPEDATMVKELLQAILQFDPTKRPTAEALLAHQWFAERASDVA